MRHNKTGWFFAHRKMQFNELYLEKPFDRWHAWEHLLVNAEYEERYIQTKKGTVHLMPGQLLIGERDFAEEVGWTRKKVRHFLGTLEGTKMVTTERTAKGTIVTIVNWGFYQNKGTSEGTDEGTAKGTDEGTLYKKYKNYKKREEGGDIPHPQFSPPTLSEIKAECEANGYTAVNQQKFFSYYEGRNWRIGGEPINWKAMLQHWDAEDRERKPKQKEHIDSDDIRDIVAGVMKRREATNDKEHTDDPC